MVPKVTGFEAIYSAIWENETDRERTALAAELQRTYPRRHPASDLSELLEHEKFIIGVAIGERLARMGGGR